MKTTIKIVVLSLFIIGSTTSLVAQTADPSPTPTERERELQTQITLLKLQKEKSELEKAIRDARPQPSTTALEGNATNAKDLKTEVNLQTYKALRRISDKIACSIKPVDKDIAGVKTFIIYDSAVYEELWRFKANRQVVDQQMLRISGQYSRLFEAANKNSSDIEKSDGAIPLVGEAVFALKSVADLLALFRTNVEFSFSAVTINEFALKSMLSNSLRREDPCKLSEKPFADAFLSDNVNVVNPTVFYPIPTENSVFVSRVNAILQQSAKAEGLIIEADFRANEKKKAEETEKSIAETNAALLTSRAAKEKLEKDRKAAKTAVAKAEIANKITEMTTTIGKLIEKKEKLTTALNASALRVNSIKEVSPLVIEQLKQLNTAVSAFYTALTTVDTTTKLSPLAQLIKVESLSKLIDDAGKRVYWLAIRVVDAGGTTRVRKNLFRSFYYPDISMNGGAIVEYSLASKDGAVIVSNVNSAVEPFLKPGNIFRANEADNQ